MPLSYVDNCTDAIIKSIIVEEIDGEIINIHDNDLRTCNEFLRGFRKKVKKIRTVKVPYFMFWILSWFVESYSTFSKGQIPPALTPYKTASVYKKRRFNNDRLIRLLNWSPSVSTGEALSKHYSYLKNRYSDSAS
jgi:nucleoside-diphosphate-sugar epimerase